MSEIYVSFKQLHLKFYNLVFGLKSKFLKISKAVLKCMLMNDAETVNYVSINVEILLAFSIFGSKQKTVSKSGWSLHFQKALAKVKCLQF